MQTFITRDGLSVAYYVDDFTDPWTNAETVLLLHAAMGSSKRWYSWVPSLARHYRVVRMDLRGHGNSQVPLPEQDFSLAHLVNDALQLLDLLGCDQAHVVGNSAGGYVAQQLAIHHGNRVKTLALYAATPGLKNSHALSWLPKIRELGMRRFMSDTIDERFDETVSPEFIAWFIEQASLNDPEFITRFVQHMCTHDFMDDLCKITAPTLIVAAGGEKIGHADAYQQMHQRIPQSRLAYIDTAGHNIGDAFPDQCVQELMQFLKASSAVSERSET